MKKNKLFLLLIMALLVIIPGSVKAFNVSVGGDCHVGTGVTPSGTAEQLCYTAVEREITFITSSANQKYFCLQEDRYLDEAVYNDTPIATYSNSGHACAVYNALRAGTITIANLRTAMGNTDQGYINFDITANGPNYTVTSVTPGSAADTYVKIQQAIWSLNNPSATCATPYEDSNTIGKINSLTATQLTKDNPTDEYMYSKITVSKNGAVTNYTPAVTGVQGAIISSNKTAAGAVEGALTGNEFYVLIPANATPTGTINVTANGVYTKASVTNVTIEEYRSNVTRNQTLGRLGATITRTTGNTSASVKLVSSPVIDFKVCKTDSKTGDPLSGVKFHVTSKDSSTAFDLITGPDGCAIKEDINKTEYTVTEVTVPNGYAKMKDISWNCENTPSGGVCKVEATNTPITLKVKKIEQDHPEQGLVGAKMQILDKDGHVFDEWTSVTEDHVVGKNIPFGKYILREEEAPDGYVISTEIEFEIKEDSYVVGNETKQYGDDAIVTVTMIDDVTKVSILKVNEEGNPLAGAVLRIELEDGTPVGEEWTTTEQPKVFTKLSFGTYYLVEVSAPEGYILQEERIPFTISQTAPDQEVVLQNHSVPDTAASKSALLLSFAMLDIALGIAIILYVRKRKVTE